MNHFRCFVRIALSALTLGLGCSALGCLPDGPPPRPEGISVGGKVLLSNGTPLAGGMLILRPETGLYGATALIQPDGSFTLQETSGKENVVPGKYQVFISFPNPNHSKLKSSIPSRYQQSEDGDSDLFVDILDTTVDLKIQLKR